MDDFAGAFNQADSLYLLDIYAASEPSIEGVNAKTLVEKIRSFGHRSANYVASMDEGVAAIAGAAGPGDLIVTLGAGSVSQAGEKILERLRGGA
jgi:UDP-N-acetylmuramate--alanine ligase